MSKIPIGKIRVIQIKSALSLAILLITSTISGCQSVNLTDLQEILSTSNLPNSSAEFCEQSGGQIQIRTQENLEPFNVCVFPDGSQCVDEAFQSGNCQAGRYFGSQAPDDITAIAAPFCEMNGGMWQYRTGAQNDQYGACVFNDNSECEGAAFYRGECRPGENFSQQGPANMVNPASQYCEQNGGTLQLRTDANGAQYGVCLFADDTECEEWAFYRGECRPGKDQPQSSAAGQHSYQNTAFGFSLDTPDGWTVRETPNMVQFQRQAYTLFIGYWPANQNPPKIRAGMPAGEYKDAGQFSMAGSMFQKRVVMQQGTLSMVDFGHGLNFGPLQLSIWLEGPQGQGKNQAVEIPQEIIAEAEAILNSLTMQP